MIKVKSSQKVFTDTETATLTGICLEHLHNLARTRHIGFIVRAAAAAGKQAGQRVVLLSRLMVLAALYPPRPPQTVAAAFFRRLLGAGFSSVFWGALRFFRSPATS